MPSQPSGFTGYARDAGDTICHLPTVFVRGVSAPVCPDPTPSRRSRLPQRSEGGPQTFPGPPSLSLSAASLGPYWLTSFVSRSASPPGFFAPVEAQVPVTSRVRVAIDHTSSVVSLSICPCARPIQSVPTVPATVPHAPLA